MNRLLNLARQHLEQDHNTKVAQITSIYSPIYTTQGRTHTKSSIDGRLTIIFFMRHSYPPTQAATLSNQSDMNMHIYSDTVAINVSIYDAHKQHIVCE